MHERIIEAWRYKLGATVIIGPILSGNVGESDLATRTVWLSDALTLVERSCTLMHELAHLALDLHPTGDETLDAAMEQRADEWVAERLIPQELLEYAQAVTDSEQEMCEICGVDEDTLRARIRMEETDALVLAFRRES